MRAAAVILAGAAWAMLAAAVGPGCGREGPEGRPAAPPAPAPAPAPAVPAGTIVALGDSLTAGYGIAETAAWPALLERELRDAGHAWRVVNAGVSGETSSGTLSRTDWVLQRLRPDVVVLGIGANDGLRGIDPALVRGNIAAIVRRLQAGGATVVLAGMQMVVNLGEGYTREFAAIYPAVANETGVRLIPFLLEGVAARRELNLPDGIHPNEAGHRIVAATVFPFVERAVREREGGKP